MAHWMGLLKVMVDWMWMEWMMVCWMAGQKGLKMVIWMADPMVCWMVDWKWMELMMEWMTVHCIDKPYQSCFGILHC